MGNTEVIDWYPVGKGFGNSYCEDASGELKIGLEVIVKHPMKPSHGVEPPTELKGEESAQEKQKRIMIESSQMKGLISKKEEDIHIKNEERIRKSSDEKEEKGKKKSEISEDGVQDKIKNLKEQEYARIAAKEKAAKEREEERRRRKKDGMSKAKETWHKEIVVTIYEGRNLVSKDKNVFGADTNSDPYVKVYYAGRKMGKTSWIENTLNPNWGGQTIKFHVDGSLFKNIECRVADYDDFSSPDPMGTVVLSFPKAFNTEVIDWYPVGKGFGNSYCEDASGELKIGLEVIVKHPMKPSHGVEPPTELKGEESAQEKPTRIMIESSQMKGLISKKEEDIHIKNEERIRKSSDEKEEKGKKKSEISEDGVQDKIKNL